MQLYHNTKCGITVSQLSIGLEIKEFDTIKQDTGKAQVEVNLYATQRKLPALHPMGPILKGPQILLLSPAPNDDSQESVGYSLT